MKIYLYFSLLTSLMLTATSVNAASIVKLSGSGICHDESSSWYDKTKNYKAFANIENCIDAGGRLPKSSKKSTSNNKLTSTNKAPRYNRADYEHWIDSDNDGMNERHELLEKTSVGPVTYNIRGDIVKTGVWRDSYTGKTFYSSKDLDIDHIVPLAYAHIRGAWKFSSDEKREFANDVANLIPVQNTINRQKSYKGLTEFLPPNTKYRCQYIFRFDRIMKKYSLEYFSSEKRTVNKMLNACKS
ncbi:conserved exported hypothetical protein [Vibrio chagasii]|nr:conserved exported hypothetical protein [Vibrio chagasii]CAH6945124.1 conserved exported hypothetical protein [Vibrio chagasii]